MILYHGTNVDFDEIVLLLKRLKNDKRTDKQILDKQSC